MCMCVSHRFTDSCGGQKRALDSPEVTDGGAGLNSGPLDKHVLLAHVPSLQPTFNTVLKLIIHSHIGTQVLG